VRSKNEALAALDESGVRVGQTWQHAKGSFYTVIATGIDEATLTPAVIYAGCDGIVWVRALEVFLGRKGAQARFTCVGDDDIADDVVATAPFPKADYSNWDVSDAEDCVDASGCSTWPIDSWGSGQPLGLGGEA
jgi:hypothetical protein